MKNSCLSLATITLLVLFGQACGRGTYHQHVPEKNQPVAGEPGAPAVKRFTRAKAPPARPARSDSFRVTSARPAEAAAPDYMARFTVESRAEPLAPRWLAITLLAFALLLATASFLALRSRKRRQKGAPPPAQASSSEERRAG